MLKRKPRKGEILLYDGPRGLQLSTRGDNPMNSTEKKRFVEELLGSVQKDAETLIDCGHFPDGWDGHELREWLADTFTRERSSTMVDARKRNTSRARAYKRWMLWESSCEDKRPLVNWEGSPFDQCWRCASTDTCKIDEVTRGCKGCGEEYAVEHRSPPNRAIVRLQAQGCQHETVDWEPVEVDHGSDGTATVTQEGLCAGCSKVVYLCYEPQVLADEIGDVAPQVKPCAE